MRTITKVLAISFSLSLLLSAVSSCDLFPEDPTKPPKPGYLDYMPEETSIGANTFGCYVNGELAAARGPFQKDGTELYKPYVSGFWDKYEYKNDTCMILDIVTKNYVFWIKIRKHPHLGENDMEFYADKRESDISFGGSDAVLNIIRFDTVEHIISGRFDNIKVPSTPIYDSNITDTLYITNGQFDIKYGQDF